MAAVLMRLKICTVHSISWRRTLTFLKGVNVLSTTSYYTRKRPWKKKFLITISDSRRGLPQIVVVGVRGTKSWHPRLPKNPKIQNSYERKDCKGIRSSDKRPAALIDIERKIENDGNATGAGLHAITHCSFACFQNTNCAVLYIGW